MLPAARREWWRLAAVGRWSELQSVVVLEVAAEIVGGANPGEKIDIA